MVRCLRLYQGGGMGPGHLPDEGGVLDQPVLMLDALNLMASFEGKLTDKDVPPLGEDGEVDHAEVLRRQMATMATWEAGLTAVGR